MPHRPLGAVDCVRSAGVEPATSRLSTWPLCLLEYEHVEPLPGADPGHPRYEGGAAAVRSGLGWDTRLRTWMLRVQGPAGLPVPPYPIGAGGGSRTRTSSCSPRFELGAAACYATPACAARESNPVSPIKSRVLHRYSPRRFVAMTGLCSQPEPHPVGAARRNRTGIPCLEGKHTSRCVSAAW